MFDDEAMVRWSRGRRGWTGNWDDSWLRRPRKRRFIGLA